MAIFKSKFYPFHTSQKNRVSNVAVKVAVTKNLVAVKGPQVAVVSGGSGSEGLPGSGNPDPTSSAALFQDLIYLFGKKRMLVERPPF